MSTTRINRGNAFRHVALGIAATMMIVSVSGCGSSGPELGQVTGVLTMDGEPVKNGSIEFIPEAGGRPSLALTDEQGRFEVYYLPNVPGALTGTHRIRFEIAKAKPGDPGLVRPKRNGGGGAVALEPSTVEVASGENKVDFKIVDAET
ncbi:carboxypeptidase regulatory-like domain-containing protein [Roseiconus nitratireducens]|uniref:Carboxypeptidase regulatory-like domain-containing protein n=1 Tax=Roseiconus nitratireducens TaxID=2605748 RepID=A0A5M6DG98_9BACT|nr:carboxypeptidase regulatory-like domain-containing protein [Roseiconus nitratireducens]KAA5545436.1 carboxypeptidase regulatory-like domain-containing protein [Roseiconus nitratireducens]